MKKILNYFFIMVAGAGLMTSCDLDIAPENSLTGRQMTMSPTGTVDILNGCYAVMKDYPENSSSNNWYGRQFYQMSDFSSDDVVYGHATTDELNMIFKFEERHPGLSNVASFWSQSYKIIYSTNVAIDVISKEDNPSDEVKSLHGEALFLKAYVMHSLVRFYAKPYKAETAANEPGIIIRENGSDASPKGRASLKETYDYIVECLLEAEKLMDVDVERSQSRCFASVGAVRALLSRVYLYMGEWDKCIEYSGKVINDSNYEIAGPAEFKEYFKSTWTSPETIWCLKMLPQDDKGSGSVASMIMKADGCWGEEGYSDPLLEDMGRGTSLENDDIRWTFVCDVNTKNGLDLIPCSKLSWQDGKPTLFSPPFLRITEMYLNRAEAYAHKGDKANALKDVNEVRKHRMTANAEAHLYTESDIKTDIVDLVLKETRVEFAFEAHRFFDLMRNGKDIVRDYWGYHTQYAAGQSTAGKPALTAPGVTTKNSDTRLVFPIPSLEINNNQICEQNPGY